MQITCNKTVNNNMEKNPSLTCQDALPSENWMSSIYSF